MNSDLKRKLDQTRDNIANLKQDAAALWERKQDAEQAFATSAADATDTNTDEFKTMDEAGKQYDAHADKIAEAEKVRDRLIQLVTASAPEQHAKRDDTDPERRAAAPEKDTRPASQRIVEGDEYRTLVESGRLDSTGQLGHVPLGKAMDNTEFKAALTGLSDTSAGAFILNDRKASYPMPLRPIRLLDLLTIGTTNSDTVEYVTQTANTNNAAEVAEATTDTGTSGTKPQSDATFAVVQQPVQTIANWIAATKRALADAGQLRTIIDTLLTYNIQARVEAQLVSGNGTAPNLRGILNTSGIGSIATGGGGSYSDRLHKGITLCRVAFFEPDAVAIHPTDWETIRLSRDDSGASAGTGGYLFGPPSVGEAATLWGLRVVPTVAVPQGTMIVGDFRQLNLWVREGVNVMASDSHSDFFVRNLVAVLAEGRFAAGIPYPAAFSKVAVV